MYCTPKIHKDGNPLRPIVDYTGSIGYNLSRSLADILSPIVGKTQHHVNNSKEFSQEMSAVYIQNGEEFISHDVVSLFTNVPIDKALQVIRERLESDKSLQKRTNLTVDNIMELLEFVLTTTYFSFNGTIYQQRFGTAMGSPVSPIVANMYMEFLEQKAIATADVEYKPRLWKRYVDDILEIVQKGKVNALTDHINSIDETGNIKFTHEEEQEGCIPFLDTLIVRKDSGSIKLLVYRKKTHTDQYLNFESHHPLHQKLGVIRTLLDRGQNIVTEESDQLVEENKVITALKGCGYPNWAFTKVKDQMKNNTKTKETKRTHKDGEKKTKGMVVIPYVKGLSETVQRIFRRHNISTAMKPHTTLRNILVNPKDRRDKMDTSDCVYQIPCDNCNKVYIGETGRNFGYRLKEHQKDVNNNSKGQYTRAIRKTSDSEWNKSAMTDHANTNNHEINWEGSKIIDKENNEKTRRIKESIHIRKTPQNMNRDEGGHGLSHLYDCLLTTTPSGGQVNTKSVALKM